MPPLPFDDRGHICPEAGGCGGPRPFEGGCLAPRSLGPPVGGVATLSVIGGQLLRRKNDGRGGGRRGGPEREFVGGEPFLLRDGSHRDGGQRRLRRRTDINININSLFVFYNFRRRAAEGGEQTYFGCRPLWTYQGRRGRPSSATVGWPDGLQPQ